MNIMRQHSKEVLDDPFAAISVEIDQENNRLVPPNEFGSGIAKPTEDSTESTEDCSTHRAEEDEVTPSKDATASAPPPDEATATSTATEEQ